MFIFQGCPFSLVIVPMGDKTMHRPIFKIIHSPCLFIHKIQYLTPLPILYVVVLQEYCIVSIFNFL